MVCILKLYFCCEAVLRHGEFLAVIAQIIFIFSSISGSVSVQLNRWALVRVAVVLGVLVLLLEIIAGVIIYDKSHKYNGMLQNLDYFPSSVIGSLNRTYVLCCLQLSMYRGCALARSIVDDNCVQGIGLQLGGFTDYEQHVFHFFSKNLLSLANTLIVLMLLQLASVVLLFYLLRMRGNCTASQIPEIGDTYGSMHVLEEDENIMILQKDEVGRPMVFM